MAGKMKNTTKATKTYRIYYSSAAGLDFTGVTAKTEAEAKALCKKYDAGRDNPYGQHIYR